MANYGGAALHQRRVRRGRGEPARGLAAARRPSVTASRRGSNSISLAFANGATNIRRRGAKKETPEEDALQGMHRMADFMRVPNMAGLAGYEHGTPGILMIPRRRGADHGRPRLDASARCASSSGSTRGSRRSICAARACPAWIEIDASKVDARQLALDPWPITRQPDNFVLVVAGGGHPTNSYWLRATVLGSSAARSSSRRPSTSCSRKRSAT